MSFRERIGELLGRHGVDADLLVVPPDPTMGEYAVPCFTIAKGANPVAFAKDLAGELSAPFLESVTALGPYVNFRIKPTEIVTASFRDPEFPANGKTVVIDLSSPNIAKPFGIGHLRSTVIGAALQRVYAFAGWKTVGINHLGDWGTQFGKLIAAYKRWPADLAQDPIKKLLGLYVRFHKEAETDPALEDAGREEFRKLEAGDEENTKLWRLFRDLSLVEFNKLYGKMGVAFDSTAGESFYNDKMEPVIEELKAKGLLELDDGAHIVRFPPEYGIETPAMLLKSDAATTYITRDLAAILYRKKTYGFDRILYEIGAEQNLHLKQLFACVRLMGYSWWEECYHVAHGLYRFDTGKMSTRKGQVIFIEDVFDRAVEQCLATIKEKNPNLSNPDSVAEAVGYGAIIFNDLKNDRNRDIVFDWDEILDFEGESGPYLQYAHARLRSILRKSAETPQENAALLTAPEEVAIARRLLMFDEVIRQVVQTNKPHTLARHLLDLAADLNAWYQNHRVIQDDKALERARLALVLKVADRLKIGLDLLGIKAPDEM